jgi:hypothetical protein
MQQSNNIAAVIFFGVGLFLGNIFPVNRPDDTIAQLRDSLETARRTQTATRDSLEIERTKPRNYVVALSAVRQWLRTDGTLGHRLPKVMLIERDTLTKRTIFRREVGPNNISWTGEDEIHFTFTRTMSRDR